MAKQIDPIKKERYKDLLEKLQKNLRGQRIKGLEETYPACWSRIKAEKCELCGNTRYLEKCHIIPRCFDWFLYRWDLIESNILILCPTCHKYFDKGLLNHEEKAKIEGKVLKAIKHFIVEFNNVQYKGTKIFDSDELKIWESKVRNEWVKSLLIGS